MILQELKLRLDEAKGNWVEELHSVLMVYHTNSSFDYRITSILPHIWNRSSYTRGNWRTRLENSHTKDIQTNDENIREDFDFVEKNRN